MSKKQTFVGIDQDSVSIRGVRMAYEPPKSRGGRPVWKLLAADEVTGDLFEDVKSLTALKKLKDKLRVAATDRVSTCLSGKQTFAVQVDVRKLPDDEMGGMLKLELRKSMPFEASVATFDYQFLPVGANHPRDALVPVIVSAATNSYVAKHVHIYERAGLRPYHVDILPISVANAFWASRDGAADTDETHVVLHVGAHVCTLVIDGSKGPFFNRTFSFSIAEAINNAKLNSEGGVSDVLLQMNILASEITKSVTYYKNTFKSGEIGTVTVMGSHATHPAFDALGKKMGYEVKTIRTAQTVNAAKPPEPGKYDLAIAVAMQAAA